MEHDTLKDTWQHAANSTDLQRGVLKTGVQWLHALNATTTTLMVLS